MVYIMGFFENTFWGYGIAWHSDDPVFSTGFNASVFIFLPCILFSVQALIKIRFIRKHPILMKSDWTFVVVAKLIICQILIIISIFEFAFIIYQRYKSELNIPDAMLYSICSQIIAYGLALYLVLLNKTHEVRFSTLLFLFWLSMSVCGFLMHKSAFIFSLNKENSDVHLISYVLDIIHFSMIYCIFFLSLFPEYYHRKSDEDPFEAASFFSFITIHWFNKYVCLGAKKLLTPADFGKLPSRLKAHHVWRCFSKKLTEIMKKNEFVDDKDASDNISAYSLACILIKAFPWHFSITIIFHIVYVALTFVPPLLLDALISFLLNDDYLWKGLFYAIALFFADFSGRAFHNISMFYSEAFSLQSRSSLVLAVYRKSLKLSSRARQDYTCGEMINLMSVDVEKVSDFCSYFGYAIGSPIKLVFSIILLWQYLGPSCLAGAVVMCVLLAVNMYMMKKASKFQEKQMKTKDNRLKLLTEIINGIKVLKLYAWEIPFMNKIMFIRTSEVKMIRAFQLCCAACCFIWGCSPFIIAALSFMTYILVDENNLLDPKIAFVSLSLLNILRDAVMDVPNTTADMIEVYVSLKRLSKFLCAEEYDMKMIENEPDNGKVISMNESTFSWDPRNDPVLREITFEVEKGSLIFAIGPVGCGKSSILSAVLGDLYKLEGSVEINGRTAYVPQQAWILNHTLKENILFVKPMVKKKYESVLDACCLKPDLEILPAGDDTEIGEKGVNLSGGQKQRVSLARAVYHDAEIYLLDDPLSSVDAHVGKHIFEHVIGRRGLLKRKTRILTTHNISYLHEADCIYSMRDGRIEEKGTYTELMNKGGFFAELIQEYAQLPINYDFNNMIGEQILTPSPMVENTLNIHNLFMRNPSFEAPESSSQNTCFGTLIDDEKMEIGEVKREAFWKYARHMSVPFLVCLIMGYLCREAFEIGANVWLSKWCSDPQLSNGMQDVTLRNRRIYVYMIVGFCQCIGIVFGSLSLAFGASRASRVFHNLMLDSIMKSPMAFFDTTPLGRIINRFGRDIDEIDMEIPQEIDEWLLVFFTVVGTFSLIAFNLPIFLIFLLPMMAVYFLIQRFFLLTSRQLKRLQSVSRSPLYSHFAETIQGSSSIRAYKVEQQFLLKCENALERLVKCRFYYTACNRWLELRLAIVGDITITIAAILVVFLRGSLDIALAALSLSYAISANEKLTWLVRTSTELENKSVSVERVDEYCKLPHEAEWSKKDVDIPPKWPQSGSIELKHYSTKYREGLDLCLQGINLKISDCEKLGVLGRTGAGKSSLMLALFRILEPTAGSVLIDNIDILKIGLHQLRSKLTAIPQDPILFTDSLRNNLDPCGSFSDDEIWNCLDHANLKTFVKLLPNGLNHAVLEDGSNFSVGQRQLICLARALLKKTRILILDEATAAVDVETDQLIQNTIRNEFKDCTVITIAHRINTIMDYDKVIVMDIGKIVETGRPSDLLENRESNFYSMAKDSGLV